MCAKHVIDFIYCDTRGGQIFEIWPVVPVIAQFLGALLVVAAARIDQDDMSGGTDDETVEGEDQQTGFRVLHSGFQPLPVTGDSVCIRVGK